MFYIPIENYEKFEKKVNAIRNKGGEVNLIKGTPTILAITDGGVAWPTVKEGTPAWKTSRKHKFIPVEVEGSYEIPGWEFVATVEHTPEGNIIRSISDKFNIPERYRTTTPECEHCHKLRDRKDTYLVRNTESGEFKQVGKSCLRSYTGGLDSQVAAMMAEFINSPEEFFGDDLFIADGRSKYFDAESFKRVAYNYVEKNGYLKDDIKWYNNLLDAYYKGEDLASKDDIDKVTDWVTTLDTSNNYFFNAVIAWGLTYLENRHLRLIASLINTYFKDLEKKKQIEIKKQTSTSEYVGNIKDKITFTVASTRVIYQKTFTYGHGGVNSTDVNRIVGTDGNIYIWSTNEIIKVGDTVTATVKSHSEYQGEKQTVVTRGKIVSSNSKLELDEE